MSIKSKFRQIKKLPDWFYKPLVWILLLWKATLRKEIIDEPGELSDPHPPAVGVAWHNRLLFFPLLFPKEVRRMTCAVISASRDGQYIADLAGQMGVRSIRGSSRKKGYSALHGVLSEIKTGNYVCFTPDGPRGPRYRMSQGPIYAASHLGVPIIPLAINYASFWELNSWDRFQIPKPFSKVTLRLGEKIVIPPDLSPEELERYRLLVEQRLNELSLSGESAAAPGRKS